MSLPLLIQVHAKVKDSEGYEPFYWGSTLDVGYFKCLFIEGLRSSLTKMPRIEMNGFFLEFKPTWLINSFKGISGFTGPKTMLIYKMIDTTFPIFSVIIPILLTKNFCFYQNQMKIFHERAEFFNFRYNRKFKEKRIFSYLFNKAHCKSGLNSHIANQNLLWSNFTVEPSLTKNLLCWSCMYAL